MLPIWSSLKPEVPVLCYTLSPMLPLPNHHPTVHVLVKTIGGVSASASEAETGGIFIGAQEAVPILNTLIELGHPHPPSGTPINMGNSTDHGILTAQVLMKWSKAFDMRYHWIKNRIGQGQLQHTKPWGLFTNHHPLAHHWLMRPLYSHSLPFFSHARVCWSTHTFT